MESRLNRIFKAMKTRCYNKNTSYYYLYGGKGITLCDEWNNRERVLIAPHCYTSKGFLSFKKWALSNGYNDKLTIDRIDGNKGYSPENCRWVNYKVQNNNRCSNKMISYKGKTQNMKQWAEELGISYQVLKMRFHRGWSADKAFEQHVRRK